MYEKNEAASKKYFWAASSFPFMFVVPGEVWAE